MSPLPFYPADGRPRLSPAPAAGGPRRFASAAAGAPRRRTVLALLAVAPLAGCGVRLGFPASYTPPAPGIDELARREVREAVDALVAFAGAADSADPDVRSLLDHLRGGLEDIAPHLRTAMDGSNADSSGTAGSGTAGSGTAGSGTAGSDANDPGAADPESAAADSAAAPGTSSPVPGSADGADPLELAAAAHRVALLAASRSGPVSASLARLLASVAAWCTWAAGRLAPPPATAGQADLVWDVAIPASDPPSYAAEDARHASWQELARTLEAAAYAYEVSAAQQDGEPVAGLAARARTLRERREDLDALFRAAGWEVPAREVGFRLPTQPPTPGDTVQLPREADVALVRHGVHGVADALPADRPRLLSGLLADAASGARRGAALPVLPGLTEAD